MKLLISHLSNALLLLLFSCIASQAQTDQWTRFRGYQGQGIQKNGSAPVNWDSSDFRWNISLPGKGHASPIVWENKIFVTSADDKKDTGYLTAVNQGDGTILWQKEFELTDLTMHKDNSLAMPTPAVDESHIYFIWYSNDKTNLYALSHDGTPRWQTEFGGIEGRFGGGSSLMLTDNCVVFTREQEDGSSVNGSWVAVNKQTGAIAWELERETCPRNSFSTPILVKNDHQEGQLIWKERPAGTIYGSPICIDGNLYCVTKAGNVMVIRADSEYQLHGIHALGEGCFSTPVMCRSGMVFRTFSQLMVLGNN